MTATTQDRPRTGGRVPPHNLDAEQSVLGALLLSTDAQLAVSEAGVSVDDFYKPAHQHVFEAMARLMGVAAPVDVVTVADELRRAGLLDDVGGPGYLLELQAITPAISHAGRYARIVRETALLRRLIRAAGEIAELGYGEGSDVAGVLDAAETMLYALSSEQTNGSALDLDVAIGSVLDDAQARAGSKDLPGLRTGFTDFDELLLGLQDATLNVVASRPAMGKSALALGIALHVAAVERRPVLFVSLEMSAKELATRVLTAATGLSARPLRTGQLGQRDWEVLGQGVVQLANVPLVIFDNSAATMTEVRAQARRLIKRFGDVGLVVVDYLQLMRSPSRETRQLEVAEVARGLKVLARDLNRPVLAMAQVNRDLESRGDKRPLLGDLRESGEIEAAADTVTMLYRDEVYNTDSTDRGLAELIVQKNRSGPTGMVKLAFLGASTRFANLRRP